VTEGVTGEIETQKDTMVWTCEKKRRVGVEIKVKNDRRLEDQDLAIFGVDEREVTID